MQSSMPALTGDELLLPNIRVRDFWAWAFGDLKLNSTRGMLAQFLVAKAVGDTRLNDDGWGDFDVLSPEGIKVEVKASGYVQSWEQQGLSEIKFSGLSGRTWSAKDGYGESREYRADVFVFAVHTCQNRDAYDPISLDQWDFYVIPGSVIRETGYKSMGLNRVRSFAGEAIRWDAVRSAVIDAARTPIQDNSQV
jgi:hypothetical protein